ncbi:MAG: hypothetical protein ABIH42_01610 [Planctomycetota bacterium]
MSNEESQQNDIPRGVEEHTPEKMKHYFAHALEKAKHNPQDSWEYSNRGTIRLQSGDDEGALEDFSTSIKLDPRNVIAYMSRCDIRLKKEDFDGAISDINKAMEITPTAATGPSVAVSAG